MEEVHYCKDPALVRVYPGVPQALTRLKAPGYAIIVISNQSGIGRGLMTDAEYQSVQSEFLRQIGADFGAGLIDASYYCPHAPDTACACRKPATGMVLRAAHEHSIDLAASYFIGDREADVECGRRAGMRSILVRTGYGAEQTCTADFVCADVLAAIDSILNANF